MKLNIPRLFQVFALYTYSANHAILQQLNVKASIFFVMG